MGKEDNLPAQIVIEIEEQPKVSVRLGGVAYLVKPPKAAAAMKLARTAGSAGEDPEAMMEMLTKWVVLAFGRSEGKKVMARLDDDSDPLDINHLTALMEKVVELQTGNPTS